MRMRVHSMRRLFQAFKLQFKQGSHFPAVTKFKGFSRVFQGSEPKIKDFFFLIVASTFQSVFTIQPFI